MPNWSPTRRSLAPARARSLICSAFRAGSLRAFILRQSLRSPTGLVLAFSFASPFRASSFARRWAVRLSLPLTIRREIGSLWSVSIPVRSQSTRLPSGISWRWSVRGGLAGLHDALRSSGLGIV